MIHMYEVEQALSLKEYINKVSINLLRNVERASHYLSLEPPKDIVISLNKFRECEGDCPNICGVYDCEREEILISLPCAADTPNPPETIIRTLAHVLIHHCQHVSGLVCKGRYSCKEFEREKSTFPYLLRPYEAEALLGEESIARALEPFLKATISEMLSLVAFKIKISNPPPFKTYLLYVEPGGKGELKGPGFVAELAGRVQINTPVLLFWPEGTFIRGEASVSILRGISAGFYVFLDDFAVDFYYRLRNRYKLGERGVKDYMRIGEWLQSISPERVEKYKAGYIGVTFPANASDDGLTVVRVVISEKTWPFDCFISELKLSKEDQETI